MYIPDAYNYKSGDDDYDAIISCYPSTVVMIMIK